MSSGWGLFEFDGADGGQGYVGSHNVFDHNLIYGNHTIQGWGGVYDFTDYSHSGNTVANTVSLNPALINYQNSPAVPTISGGEVIFSNADYHETSGSPAVNAGMSTNAPTTDFDGITRPQGSAYDIGAYEWH